MKTPLSIALALLSLCSPVFADRGSSISDLPDYIKAPESGFALVADYEHPSKGGIPVYLINRSGKDIQLEAQDGDLYLKLEHQNSRGQWERAQPHAYSWCGNSYFSPPALRHDHFIIITGFQPAQGDAAKVRFRLYQHKLDIASNIGQGLMRRDDVEKARNDAMAVSFGDFELVASLARGTRTLENKMDHVRDLREAAIYQLGSGRFDRAKAEEVLREIAASKDERYRSMAQGQLNGLK